MKVIRRSYLFSIVQENKTLAHEHGTKLVPNQQPERNEEPQNRPTGRVVGRIAPSYNAVKVAQPSEGKPDVMFLQFFF